MKRKSRFFIGFLTAAITFGTLMATMGTGRFMNHRHHQCHRQCDNSNMEQNEIPNNSNKTIE